MKTSFVDKTSSVAPSSHLYKNIVVISSTIEKDCIVGDESRIKDSILEEKVEIARRNNIQNSKIGFLTHTGENTVILSASIGKFCTISWNCSIGGGEHNLKGLSLIRSSRIFPKKDKENYYIKNLEIGNDVWIAAGAHILRGVKVGNGAVIGAGAVVTKDVPPYSIVVGVPAKIIGFRFSESIIDRLEKIGWWDFPASLLEKCQADFDGDLDENKLKHLEEMKEKMYE